MLKSKQNRIVARKLARELSPEEIAYVAGGGNTPYYDSVGNHHVDTNYS